MVANIWRGHSPNAVSFLRSNSNRIDAEPVVRCQFQKSPNRIAPSLQTALHLLALQKLCTVENGLRRCGLKPKNFKNILELNFIDFLLCKKNKELQILPIK